MLTTLGPAESIQQPPPEIEAPNSERCDRNFAETAVRDDVLWRFVEAPARLLRRCQRVEAFLRIIELRALHEAAVER